MWQYLKNGWNWVHLFGSFTLCTVLMTFHPLGWLLTLIAGAVWEGLDELNYRSKAGVWLFDPTGADWRDLLMDAAGIVGACLIYSLGA